FKGKTGPCTDEILRSGIREVIVASSDPNPLVAGKGLAKLKKAGVSVSMREDFKQSFELNPGFFKRMRTGLPWVRVKIAKSFQKDHLSLVKLQHLQILDYLGHFIGILHWTQCLWVLSREMLHQY
ncbi:MAG: hypothetical protein EBW94_05820, partial [Proteobacteria bacterium]|nr:hypothetical protein [Pseudomonadota bacterium]